MDWRPCNGAMRLWRFRSSPPPTSFSTPGLVSTDLGRAYLEAGAFLQADSSFERCLKRRGEALSLFLDDEPSYGYFPPVYYYQGRVREALKSAKAAESYKAYLDIRGKSKEDPLVPEVRRRATRPGADGAPAKDLP